MHDALVVVVVALSSCCCRCRIVELLLPLSHCRVVGVVVDNEVVVVAALCCGK
jgi:hypothetical protein